MKKLVLYGCGKIGREWLKRLGNENVYCFTDSDEKKVGQIVDGKEVIALEKLVEIKEEIEIYISTSQQYYIYIYSKIQRTGLAQQVVGYPMEDVRTSWDSWIDAESCFEGQNWIGENSCIDKCNIGYASYVAGNASLYNTLIGKYSAIGPNVRIILGQHPASKFVSIHPMFYSTNPVTRNAVTEKNIFEENRYTLRGFSVEIGNDVWIGNGASIMEGVKIADGTIVAANANVVKDTEPYSIVGGNPARIIRKRFDEKDIDFLLKLRWWEKDVEWIEMHAPYFQDIALLKEMVCR